MATAFIIFLFIENEEALDFLLAVSFGILPNDIEHEVLSPENAPEDLKRQLKEIRRTPEFKEKVTSYKQNVLPEELEAFLWVHYEAWRCFSSSLDNMPDEYWEIIYLLEKGIVNTVITTNYDLCLDTALDSSSRGSLYSRNPCVGDDNEWDFRGYYTKRMEAPCSQLTYWKTHGDLAYMCWEKCLCLERLTSETSAKHFWREIDGEKVHAKHYHDYNAIPRHIFNREIKQVVKHLNETVDETAMIITLGFRGDYDEGTGNGEELVPALLEFDANPNASTYMLISPTNFIEGNYSLLWDSLLRKDQAIQSPKDSDLRVSDILMEIISRVRPFFADFKSYMDRKVR